MLISDVTEQSTSGRSDAVVKTKDKDMLTRVNSRVQRPDLKPGTEVKVAPKAELATNACVSSLTEVLHSRSVGAASRSSKAILKVVDLILWYRFCPKQPVLILIKLDN